MPKNTLYKAPSVVSTNIELEVTPPTKEEAPFLRKVVEISPAEEDVLKKVLDRNRTSMAVHGGLKSLFVLTDNEAAALLNFLERI